MGWFPLLPSCTPLFALSPNLLFDCDDGPAQAMSLAMPASRLVGSVQYSYSNVNMVEHSKRENRKNLERKHKFVWILLRQNFENSRIVGENKIRSSTVLEWKTCVHNESKPADLLIWNLILLPIYLMLVFSCSFLINSCTNCNIWNVLMYPLPFWRHWFYLGLI